jgi:Sulfotransferase domain
MLNRSFKSLKYAARILLGRQNAGRNLTVLPDDIFLVSYPRSGNTWTRFLIGNLIHSDEPITFASIESRVPEIYLWRDRDLRSLPRPRILKSHEYFDPRYRTVINIVRDPRDVAVSVYHYSIKRSDIPDGYPMQKFVPRFIAGEFFEDWGTWDEHVSSWIATRTGKPGYLLLVYEEMLADPQRALFRVAEMLNIDTTPAVVNRAVEMSSASQMRSLEKQEAHKWKLTKETRQDKPFVRAAKSGGWREVLNAESLAAIESAWGSTMRKLGYLPSSATKSTMDQEDLRSSIR